MTAHASPNLLTANAPILAFDTASPVVGVAVVDGAHTLAEVSAPQPKSSRILLGMVDRVLASARLQLDDLYGLVALAGPGSFTGLRVGLATVLGLHQATGLPATALPTLDVLAAAAPAGEAPVLAVVDARRGDYFAQVFTSEANPQSLCKAQRIPATSLPQLCTETFAVSTIVGFELEALQGLTTWPERMRWLEPTSLAACAGRLAAIRADDWDSAQLTRPLYLEAPAVTRPRG